MADIKGTNLASGIVPFSTEDEFATHYSKYGNGGWHEVASITERDAITDNRLSVGMAVYVLSENKLYIYKGKEIDPETQVKSKVWQEFTGGITGIAWGDITGTLASQTDLNDELTGLSDRIGDAEDNISELQSEIENIIVKSETIPDASTVDVGSVYMYMGQTNATYTHGYIYQRTNKREDTMIFSDNDISCDWTALAVFLASKTADYNNIAKGTMEYIVAANLWKITFNAENDDEILHYQQYTGDWEEVGFVFGREFTTDTTVTFTRNTTETPQWERMDVQPAGQDAIWGNITGTLANQTDLQSALDAKQDKTDNDLATVSKTVVGAINELDTKVEEIEAARFPNAVIIGTPTISQGQVSNFTTANYLQFPFLVDLTNRRFTAEFCFTTGDDVTTQQNILDSQFGLALAISNGKGLMAISHNGTSWAGSVVGTKTIEPNTTYYAKLSWNRINYQTQLSTDGTTYTPDMNFGSTQSPYPRTMFIGGCSGTAIGHTAHPFKGTINLNKCRLFIEDVEVWQGMDDVGLVTRADVSLDNLDARGEARFSAKQDVLTAGTNITIVDNVISATGGGADEDNVTITKNTSNQIQAVGLINKNSSSSDNVFDWVGTLAEYTQQNIETQHPDWVCFITDDIVPAGGKGGVSATYDEATKTIIFA